MIFPVYAPVITSPFGERLNPNTNQFQNHMGIDVVSQVRNNGVFAPEACTVQVLGNEMMVLRSIENPLRFYRFLHVRPLALQIGARLEEGYMFGNYQLAGTGAHVHIEITEDGKYRDPEAFFLHTDVLHVAV